LVDNDNQEPLIRILGGLIGVVVAYSYNKMLIATRDNKDDEGFYYRFVWGREPVPDEAESKVVPAASDRKYGRYNAGRYSKTAVVIPSGQDGSGGYDPAECDMHTICVTQTRCKKHPDGFGCTAECKSDTAGGGWASNFKLRIPYTLDHPK
jgi:hypothetical protein